MEPHADQWAYLSSLSRMTPGELSKVVHAIGSVRVGTGVDRLAAPTSTKTRPQPAPVIEARRGAGISLNADDLTPSLLATLKHAASMPNPIFYEHPQRQTQPCCHPLVLDGGVRHPLTQPLDPLADTLEDHGSSAHPVTVAREHPEQATRPVTKR